MSARDWQEQKCWDCKFATIYGRAQDTDLKRCRRFPPTRLPRNPGEINASSGYPDVTIMPACAEFTS